MPGHEPVDSATMARREWRETNVSGFADYEQYDATGLADLVRRRQVSPTELLEAAIERVQARNGAVNAVTMPLYDYARAAIAAGLPDGPFTGVPFLMKDLTAAIAGVPMTRSSQFFADAPPPTADSEHVARLKRAGLVIFGRTNTCELGPSLTCEPRLHGPTRNPWDPTRISGGSSGGAAAAVGARMLPMAHATDGFGSIRAPAACCGVVGLKPTRGRNTMAPVLGEGLGRLLCGARGDPVRARLRGAARRDVRCGRGRPLRRAPAGSTLPAGSRRRSGRAAHRVHEPGAERCEDRDGEPARAHRDGWALRRARAPGRAKRPGDGSVGGRADVPHARRGEHRGEPGEPPDERPRSSRGRGRDGDVGHGQARREGERRRLRSRHAGGPSARAPDGRVPW